MYSPGLPTPNSRDHKGGNGTQTRVRKGRGKPYNPGDIALPDALAMLPTPVAGDRKMQGSNTGRIRKDTGRPYTPGDRGLTEVVHMLPTPRVQHGGGGGLDLRTDRKPGKNLATIVFLLSTPAARDHKGRSSGFQAPYALPNDVLHLERSWGIYEPAIQRWEQVLGRPAPKPLEPAPRSKNGRLNPAFTEWMMGLKPGYVTQVDGLNRQQVLTILGNGCVPQQVVLALKMLMPEVPVTEEKEKESMPSELQVIPIDQLHPHPDNPRLAERTDVIDAIAGEIAKNDGKFDVAYAPKVRPLQQEEPGYQVISGHNRRLAAIKAGLTELPCWVDTTMDDATAFMQLVLSNSQAELSPLELGMHALTYEKGGGALAGYATEIGKDRSYVTQLRGAAKVAQSIGDSHESPVEMSQLLGSTWQLYEINKAPEEVQLHILYRMLASKWTVADTVEHVKAVREIDTALTADGKKPHEQWLPLVDVVQANLDTGRFSATAVKRLMTAATDTAKWMRGAFDEPAPEVQGLFAWLITNQGPEGEAWDARQILAYRRRAEARLASEQEAHYVAQGWHHGNWREYIDELKDGSVALILTDPPYGVAFQSNMRKEKHERIVGDDDTEMASKEVAESLAALQPKLTPDAHLLVFCNWRSEFEMREVIEKAGFEIKGSLVWAKGAPSMGDLTGSFSPSHERIIHATQGDPILYRRINDVLNFSRVKSDRHPTEKPEDLLSELISVTTAEGQLVADPFAGVASTPAAAKATDRHWWACEIEEKYFRAGEERLLSE